MTAFILGVLFSLNGEMVVNPIKADWFIPVINYGCTYTLMLSMKTIDSSLLFPIHNIGIVAIGAIVGWLAYGEKLKPHQVFGIILAAASIALLCI